MPDRTISARNLGFLIVLMSLNCTMISGFNNSGHNVWITMVISLLVYLPLNLICCRVASLNPGQGLFDMLPSYFGRAVGGILSAIVVVFTLGICALVLCNFGEFILQIALNKTPVFITIGAMALTAAYLANSGLENMGKFAFGTIILVAAIVVLTIVLSLDLLDVQNILPIQDTDPWKVLKEGTYGGMIAFGESAMLLSFMGKLKRGDSPYKAYAIGIGVAFLLLISVFLRNILVLGGELLEITTFPPYIISRIIKLGTFFEHIESIISFNYILFGITKVAICIRTAVIGSAKVMRLQEQDMKFLVLPLALITTALAAISFSGIEQILKFVSLYFYLSLPIWVAIPTVLWICSEVRHRRQKKRPPEPVFGPPPPYYIQTT